MSDRPPPARALRSAALFIVLLSVVDLFADFTYEGARSAVGPFLALLGASGTVVGVVAGLGELLGYSLRLVSGTLADRTRRYWPIAFVGYAVNLFSVPFLALCGRLPAAVALLLAERTGRAIRAPARDAMLSHAAHQTGRGWGFGLHEALDQTGAVLGPLAVAAALASGRGYRVGFGMLAVPAILAVSVLLIARRLFPQPQRLEVRRFEGRAEGLLSAYWIFLACSGLIAAGYADFSLMAFHLRKSLALEPARIAAYYALGMATHALAALAFGRLYDAKGLKVLAAGTAISIFCAPLVFLGHGPEIAAGVAAWGVGLGAIEALMRAAVADMSAAHRRGTAYGMFNFGYGLMWFAGSVLMGWLYDRSIAALVAFSVAAQAAAMPLLLVAHRRFQDERA